MAAMVRDQPEAEEDLPEMDSDLRDSDLPDRDLPATVTDRGEYLPSSVLHSPLKYRPDFSR